MKPEDVPDELVKVASGGLMGREIREIRAVLADVIPVIEQQVREQVAAEIAARRCPARVCSDCRCRAEDARIARGEPL